MEATISRGVEPETAEEGRRGRGDDGDRNAGPKGPALRLSLSVSVYLGLCYLPSRKGFNRRDRDGWRSFLSAFASI